jgi:hypothetical protein
MAYLINCAWSDNLAGQNKVGWRPPVHILIPLINIRNLTHFLLSNIADDSALTADLSASQTK